MNIRNLNYLRGIKSPDFPDLGARLYETFKDVISSITTVSQQTNTNTAANPKAPPPINSLSVTAQDGHFNAQIVDNNNIYRGVQYYVEHDSLPNFPNPQIIHLGDSRNHSVYLGNQVRYWRAYSSYASSGPSAPVYHGSATQPIAVTGGGSSLGPLYQESQGSGTGTVRQGVSGPGPIPYRTTTGAPPTR